MPEVKIVTAPVSGVADIKVAVGDSISEGGLLAIQNMVKTQTNVSSPVTGRITKIAQQGETIAEGDVIAEIEY
ncbi:hypothetical protein HWV62_14706 [Athelia sp. TMB]|nr:hypothetical protein HWV62_14706 [Athelia sp. TMB]